MHHPEQQWNPKKRRRKGSTKKAENPNVFYHFKGSNFFFLAFRVCRAGAKTKSGFPKRLGFWRVFKRT